MDLNYDGLMIETHPTPEKAWSDASQQVTPAGLRILLDSLTLRSSHLDETAQAELQNLRGKIELLDDRLFELLSQRMGVAEEAECLERKKQHYHISTRTLGENDL